METSNDLIEISELMETEPAQPSISHCMIEPDPYVECLDELIPKARALFNSGITKNIEFRIEQLKKLLSLVEELEDSIISTLRADFRKPIQETIIYEIEYSKNYIRNMLQNVRKWSKPKKSNKPFYNYFDKILIQNEPYGIILIVGAWCYPIQSILTPLAAGIASGNCVFVVPHSISESSFQFLNTNIPKYLNWECYVVLNYPIKQINTIIKKKFDYIYFTGLNKSKVQLYETALTSGIPFTVQLSGKCPCFIDNSVDISLATKRIWFAKLFNLGQSHTGPDYLLCSQRVEELFIKATATLMRSWTGENFRKDKHLFMSRLINDELFTRLMQLIESKSFFYGGRFKQKFRFIEPTVFTDVSKGDECLNEEILGPILPIIHVDNVEKAVKVINEKEMSLVIYVFTDLEETKLYFKTNTKSHVLSINDTFTYPNIDIYSGTGYGGNYVGDFRGRNDYETFSLKRTITEKGQNSLSELYLKAFYPPFNGRKLVFLKTIMTKKRFYFIHVITVIFAFITYSFRDFVSRT